jgi:hypothetical protein
LNSEIYLQGGTLNSFPLPVPCFEDFFPLYSLFSGKVDVVNLSDDKLLKQIKLNI